jgi:hypothetical protein
MTRAQIERMLLEVLNHFGEYPELTDEELDAMVDIAAAFTRYEPEDKDYEI